MTRVSETEVVKSIRSYGRGAEVEVTIEARHSDSEKANDVAHRIHHAVVEVLDE